MSYRETLCVDVSVKVKFKEQHVDKRARHQNRSLSPSTAPL
jgi:hypothetical protein